MAPLEADENVSEITLINASFAPSETQGSNLQTSEGMEAIGTTSPFPFRKEVLSLEGQQGGGEGACLHIYRHVITDSL